MVSLRRTAVAAREITLGCGCRHRVVRSVRPSTRCLRPLLKAAYPLFLGVLSKGRIRVTRAPENSSRLVRRVVPSWLGERMKECWPVEQLLHAERAGPAQLLAGRRDGDRGPEAHARHAHGEPGSHSSGSLG